MSGDSEWAARRTGLAPVGPRPAEVATLCREGEYWAIGTGGAVHRLRDSKGLRYLAHLLERPDQDVSALDLVAAGRDPGDREQMVAAAAIAEDLTVGGLGDAGPVLDAAAKTAYKRRLVDLEAELDEAEAFHDPERAEHARQEIDFLRSELAAAVGLGGRDRRVASASERARVNVTRAIKSTLEKVAKDDQALGDYLAATIHTGTWCRYQPLAGHPVSWRFDQSPAALGKPSPAAVQPVQLPLPPLLRRTEERPFVGREAELQRLTTCWHAVRDGSRSLALIAGEPGIGKTRMAREFCRMAHAEGATVLLGRCDEEALSAYQPFIEALRYYVDENPTPQLREVAAHGGGELARILPTLRDRLADLPEPVPGDPDGERYRLFEAVLSLLHEASRRTPLVLVLDDLQWADKPTLLLFRHIMRSAQDAPLLVLATVRTTELFRAEHLSATLADLRRDVAFERISIEGLNEAGVAALITAGTDREPAAALTRAIHRNTEGNPFFIAEVMRHLEEVGALQERGGRWTSSLAVETVGVPQGVKEVIAQRLTRLGDEARRVLAVAAVMGQEFDLSLLQRIAGCSDDDLVDALEDNLSCELIEEVPDASARYRFSHALIRETLYEQLSAARRARLHHRVGEALEELGEGALEPYLPELAYHFSQAAQSDDVVEGAIAYARRAADAATASLAYEEAAEHYRRALDVLERRRTVPTAEHCELLLSLGESEWLAGSFDAAREAFTAAAALAQRLDAPHLLARAALGGHGEASALHNAGQMDAAAVELLRRALDRLPEGDSAIRARLLAQLAGELLSGEDRTAAAACGEDARRMARAAGDRATLAFVLMKTHVVTWTPDNRQERVGTLAEVIELCQGLGDGFRAMVASVWRLCDLVEGGDFATFDRELATCKRTAEQLRLPYYTWLVTLVTNMRLLMDGRFAELEEAAGNVLVAGQESHNENAVQIYGSQLLFIRRDQDRIGELAPLFEEFVDRYPGGAWRVVPPYIHSEGGDRDKARAAFEALAADGFAGMARGYEWLPAMWIVAETCVALEDASRAQAIYDLLLPYAGSAPVVPLAVCMGSLSRSLGRLAALMERFDAAAAHFEEALRMNRTLRLVPFVADVQYEHARALLARGAPGDGAKAAELLDAALATARELGMPRLERRIRALRR